MRLLELWSHIHESVKIAEPDTVRGSDFVGAPYFRRTSLRKVDFGVFPNVCPYETARIEVTHTCGHHPRVDFGQKCVVFENESKT